MDLPKLSIVFDYHPTLLEKNQKTQICQLALLLSYIILITEIRVTREANEKKMARKIPPPNFCDVYSRVKFGLSQLEGGTCQNQTLHHASCRLQLIQFARGHCNYSYYKHYILLGNYCTEAFRWSFDSSRNGLHNLLPENSGR